MVFGLPVAGLLMFWSRGVSAGRSFAPLFGVLRVPDAEDVRVRVVISGLGPVAYPLSRGVSHLPPRSGPRTGGPPGGADRRCVTRAVERSRQNTLTPYALSASVTGWKNVVPPLEQLPLPPEVRPSAVLPENNAPPLSPGSAQTLVWIMP